MASSPSKAKAFQPASLTGPGLRSATLNGAGVARPGVAAVELVSCWHALNTVATAATASKRGARRIMGSLIAKRSSRPQGFDRAGEVGHHAPMYRSWTAAACLAILLRGAA